ncbi:helix-turn-helix domain-containing protein [Streptomyces zaehneri]|nr:hypothetical protein [Streptomyces sp. DSM 40713]
MRREGKITLDLIGEGLTNRQIGAGLHLAETTSTGARPRSS